MTMLIKRAEYSGSYVNLSQLPPGSLPEIALVGRSNVGKSSMINRLVNRRNLAKSSSTPGKTRTINYYFINAQWYLVDLPGYGFARVAKTEKEKWGRMIENYLRSRTQLRGVIQLLDIRHAPNQNDILMKNWLQNSAIPLLVVATKADKVSRGARQKNLNIIRKTLELDENPLVFSAETGEGGEDLAEAISEIIS
ncbi:MAG: ribosome biogenesis GTP-binding protein YihA/YsxC [Syntrophomonadaceae bacterium]|nr:ribosome biogenesis GTP-binding protein YihA/YsxC [Syntrophomonadaceae bacterium]